MRDIIIWDTIKQIEKAKGKNFRTIKKQIELGEIVRVWKKRHRKWKGGEIDRDVFCGYMEEVLCNNQNIDGEASS